MAGMKIQADPKVDYAFKYLFGREQSKPALISLLDAVLQSPSGKGIASVELLSPFNEKEALDDKLSVLDIKVRDETGRQFNVEMQMLAYGAFRPRVLYYWSRLHQGQLQEGDDYSALRPTIAVCFVDTPLFQELSGYHHVFELRERHYQTLFTNQMELHILELVKFNKTVGELMTPLDRWLYFLRHAEELDLENLPQALNVQEIRWALRGLSMISQTDRDRELYESRLKMRRDVSAALAEARQVGEAEGIEKGIERGIERGIEKGIEKGIERGIEKGRIDIQIQRVRSLQRLLRQEIEPQEELLTRSFADLEALVERLEGELIAKLGHAE